MYSSQCGLSCCWQTSTFRRQEKCLPNERVTVVDGLSLSQCLGAPLSAREFGGHFLLARLCSLKANSDHLIGCCICLAKCDAIIAPLFHPFRRPLRPADWQPSPAVWPAPSRRPCIVLRAARTHVPCIERAPLSLFLSSSFQLSK